jgi:hypothetical protein
LAVAVTCSVLMKSIANGPVFAASFCRRIVLLAATVPLSRMFASS